jgi:hypothetical protein
MSSDDASVTTKASALFETLRTSRRAQLLALVPNTLAVICYLEDIGPIAQGIINKIEPAYRAAENFLEGLLPGLPEGWVGISLFFPLAGFGLYDVFGRKAYYVGPVTVALALVGYMMFLTVASQQDLSIASFAIDWWLPASLVSLILIGGLFIGWLFGGKGQIPVAARPALAMPIFAYVGIDTYLRDPQQRTLVAVLLATILAVLPLWNPRRLRDLAGLVILFLVIAGLGEAARAVHDWLV